MPPSSSLSPRPRAPSKATHDSPPSSPFSATPSSLSRPPLAHFAPQSTSSPLPSPFGFSSPSTAQPGLNGVHARSFDLYRSAPEREYEPPQTFEEELDAEDAAKAEAEGMKRSASAEGPPSPSAPARGGRERRPQPRRSSVGSLQGVMDRDSASRAASSSASVGALSGFDFLRRTPSKRMSGDSDALPPIEDEPAGGGSGGAAQVAKEQLSQLSWGTWWPFSVVEPERARSAAAGEADSAAPTPPAKDVSAGAAAKGGEEDSHAAQAGFLSLFAGKKAVQDAEAERTAQRRQDKVEEELLGADVEEVQRRSIEEELRKAMGDVLLDERAAPELPPKRDSVDKALPPSPERSPPLKAFGLPNLFSSRSTSSSSDTAAASLLNLASEAAASSSSSAEPKSKSLLSSLTLANPFTSSSAGSLFSSAPFSSPFSSSPTRPAAAHTRQFSSSSIRRRSTGSTGRPSADGREGNEDQREPGEGSKANKQQVKGMVDEGDRQAVEEGIEENDDMYAVLKDKYQAPKLPIVFCHGLFGFDYLGPATIKPLKLSYWVGVAEALEAMGCEVMIGRVPASASIEERATVLETLIAERFPGREVNLIGHSMGGLDGRYLISRLKPTAFKVASLTTISTPHRGSSFADYLLDDVLGAEKVPAFLAVMRGLGVPGGGKAFENLTTHQMARFNEDTPDDPSVKYYSYGAEFVATWSNPFYIPYNIITKREGPNDGLVSVKSAKWGEYRATLFDVNHLDLIGWTGKIRYTMAELWGRPVRFKPLSLYMSVAEQLALEGL
ncbi:hypothetical protein JCM8097_006641 [Rhodosporidiobolus ruineniae]